MDSKFAPPINKEEFVERLKPLTKEGARGVLGSLRSRRIALVKAIDLEIQFYEKAVEYFENGDAEWPPKVNQ